MQHLTEYYNSLAKNRTFAFVKSLLTSAIFITIYIILGAFLTLFLIYKIGVAWYWINTQLINKGYLPHPGGNNEFSLEVRWMANEFMIAVVLGLLISVIVGLIYCTIEKVNSDLDKFDIEAQKISAKREH